VEGVVLDVAGDEGLGLPGDCLCQLKGDSISQLIVSRGYHGVPVREVLPGSTEGFPEALQQLVDVQRVLRRKHG